MFEFFLAPSAVNSNRQEIEMPQKKYIPKCRIFMIPYFQMQISFEKIWSSPLYDGSPWIILHILNRLFKLIVTKTPSHKKC